MEAVEGRVLTVGDEVCDKRKHYIKGVLTAREDRCAEIGSRPGMIIRLSRRLMEGSKVKNLLILQKAGGKKNSLDGLGSYGY